MPRKRWIWSDKEMKLIPEEEYYAGWTRISAPYVIPDEMNATIHPCTGEHVTSKSNFRKITRANGCVEVGNEKLQDRRQNNLDFSGISAEIRRAWEDSGG